MAGTLIELLVLLERHQSWHEEVGVKLDGLQSDDARSPSVASGGGLSSVSR